MDSNKIMKLIKFIGLLAGTTLLFATQMNVFASENDFELPVSTYDFLNSVDNTQEMLDRAGMVCRLYIPDCDINTALFNVTGMKNVEKQPIVDSADSGLWQESTDVVVVGDHAYEGFSTRKFPPKVTAPMASKISPSGEWLCRLSSTECIICVVFLQCHLSADCEPVYSKTAKYMYYSTKAY